MYQGNFTESECTKYSSYWNIAPGCEMLGFRICHGRQTEDAALVVRSRSWDLNLQEIQRISLSESTKSWEVLGFYGACSCDIEAGGRR